MAQKIIYFLPISRSKSSCKYLSYILPQIEPLDNIFRMLRKLNIASQVVRRNIHITRTSPSFFKNLKESIDKEAAKEGIKEDLKKTQIDLEQIAQEQKIKAEKFAESDKFKKVLK